MNTENSSQPDPATSIGLVASLLAAIIWVVYGLTGVPQWLLVVGVVFSMLVGGWWAYGHRFLGGGRQRDRDRTRQRL
ncbi:hypothetical protein Q9R19_09510 [Microbacterium sp. ARD32]|uniref:hypothetical protein n=1 Tax=Microbacterium sp. ARD32 TaxID=2962577 RepID=UPI002881E1FA|nr:hypothetical protein [Microbacterium sp. ARD32]MDT0157858.1 hypothetical protein [Microbacterium sp. ARD32]